MSQSSSGLENVKRTSGYMAKAMSPSFESFSGEEADAAWTSIPKARLEIMFGSIVTESSLLSKTKFLITLVTSTMQGTSDKIFWYQKLKYPQEAWVAEREIDKVIGLILVFAGNPALAHTMAITFEFVNLQKEKDDR